MVKRGALIVLEGCDRSGKSTQSSNLVNYLTTHNIDSKLQKFPDRTTRTGQMINSYLTNATELNDQAVHLLFSANRWEAMDHMRSMLLSGTTLVVDRYVYSGVAFTAAKGLDINWCKQPDVGMLTPDLVLFLDLPIEAAEQRGGFGDERYEKRDMQIKVRELFLKLQDPLWQIIDANRTMQEIEIDIRQRVLSTLDKTQDKPLKQDLWTDKIDRII
ncbi:putative thymidylate kinase [Umbelopsis sp. PMI_123]|nr:putative thymidylate kinase [Umbelopsis sp. PMI_123]